MEADLLTQSPRGTDVIAPQEGAAQQLRNEIQAKTPNSKNARLVQNAQTALATSDTLLSSETQKGGGAPALPTNPYSANSSNSGQLTDIPRLLPNGQINNEYLKFGLENGTNPVDGTPMDKPSFFDEYEGTKFNSARVLTDGEKEAIYETAELLGADQAGIDKLKLFFSVFPPTVTYVDDLAETTARDVKNDGSSTVTPALTGGSAFVAGTWNIVMDSKFKDNDYDDGSVGGNAADRFPDTPGANLFLHEFVHFGQVAGVIPHDSTSLGDRDYQPELDAGVPVSELSVEDQATFAQERLARRVLADAAV